MTRSPRRASPGRRIGSGVLLVAFGALFLYFLLPELLMNLRARGWQATACTIIESRVAEQESKDTEELRTLYRADIRYSYEVEGKRYEAIRYRFANPYTNDEAAAHAVVRQFAAGTQATCYVNSAQPELAVLDRSLSPYHFFSIIPLVFVLLGLWELGAGLASLAGRS